MMRTQGADDEDLAGSLGSQMSGMVLGTQLRRPSSAGAHGAEGGHAHGHGHRRTVRTSINEGGIRAQYVFAGASSAPLTADQEDPVIQTQAMELLSSCAHSME